MIGEGGRQLFGDDRFRGSCGCYAACFQADATEEEVKLLAEDAQGCRGTDSRI